jgi:hypothetical protein
MGRSRILGQMLVSVFGTPSPLTYWTLFAVRTITQIVYPESNFLQAARISDLQQGWDTIAERSRKTVVFFSDCPEPPITEMFLSLGVPIMLVADEPEDIIPYFVAARDMQVEHALRFSSQCLCALAALCGKPNVWDVRKAQYAISVREYVRAICDFFRITPTQEEMDAILYRLVRDTARGADSTIADEIALSVPHASRPGEYAPLDRAGAALANRVGSPYGALLRGEPMEHTIWPREIFVDWDRRPHFVSGPVPMVGRSRFLICGPYLHLPAGNWNARVEIEVDDNFSQNRLGADILCGGDAILAGIVAPLPAQGVFTFEMAFTVTDPFRPLEIRFEILQGAIEGMFLLRQAELRRADSGFGANRMAHRDTPAAETILMRPIRDGLEENSRVRAG